MDVRQEDVACRPSHADIILQVQRQLEIVTPVLSVVTVVGYHGVLKEHP